MISFLSDSFVSFELSSRWRFGIGSGLGFTVLLPIFSIVSSNLLLMLFLDSNSNCVTIFSTIYVYVCTPLYYQTYSSVLLLYYGIYWCILLSYYYYCYTTNITTIIELHSVILLLILLWFYIIRMYYYIYYYYILLCY